MGKFMLGTTNQSTCFMKLYLTPGIGQTTNMVPERYFLNSLNLKRIISQLNVTRILFCSVQYHTTNAQSQQPTYKPK